MRIVARIPDSTFVFQIARYVAVLVLLLVVLHATVHAEERPILPNSSPATEAPVDIETSTPAREGLGIGPLLGLTEFVLKKKPPVYSILISRNGKLVYEMYTSGLTRDHAHYLMSITKSFTSTLVGIAIDQGLIKGLDQPVSDLFPVETFPSAAKRTEFQKISLRNVLSMSALDAVVPPHSRSQEAAERNRLFHEVENRSVFALEQKIIARPGEDFQYQDITPALATGALFYATEQRPFEFAQNNLMAPLNFKNAEWMHRDPTGIDLGSYGLRLRPVDMQKLGMIYVNQGQYRGKQIVSRKWVDQTLQAQVKTSPQKPEKNYGNYFWHSWDAPKFKGILAIGWRGQRIAIYPESGVVVSMTGWHSDADEEKFFSTVIQDYVIKAFYNPEKSNPESEAKLISLLEQVNKEVNVIRQEPDEERMVPSIDPLED